MGQYNINILQTAVLHGLPTIHPPLQLIMSLSALLVVILEFIITATERRLIFIMSRGQAKERRGIAKWSMWRGIMTAQLELVGVNTIFITRHI